jgi:acetoin:2,6-dichlorophenolindophenol oxidoreductase subunit beta
MKEYTFDSAIDLALSQAMVYDERIIVFGEDVETIRAGLTSRFGQKRVFSSPISESAFVGAAVSAAMAGMRPVVEVMLVDFIAVAMDAVLNHAAKITAFSGGNWRIPLVIRSSCGGGYGDGGQHEQSLWGWLAHIPGLKVVVPGTPADAAGLMMAAIEDDDPVIFLEHKLLSDIWLDYMGYGGRKTVSFDVPSAGRKGPLSDPILKIGIGTGDLKLSGNDVSIISVGVGVHRALEAATALSMNKIKSEVIDLRTVSPLDKDIIFQSVRKTGHLVVVDEDYTNFGMSGEIAAVCLEAGVKFKFRRVCTDETIPYDRKREEKVLPNVDRIIAAVEGVLGLKGERPKVKGVKSQGKNS